MKRNKGTPKGKSSHPNDTVADDQSSNSACVEPDDLANDDHIVEVSFDLETHGRIESQGPGKNVLTPDIYGNEQVVTVPDLKILDPSSPDTDESTGFNPYDTAALRKK